MKKIPQKTVKRVVMRLKDRKTFSVMYGLGLLMTLVFGFWWFGTGHVPSNFSDWRHIFDFLLFGLLSYVVWYQIINEVFFWNVARKMKRPVQVSLPKKGMRVAFLTAFVPGKEPYDILEKTLKAMVRTKYSHDTWLLDEGNDIEAKRICKKYGVKHFSRKGIEKYNQPEGAFMAKTKAGNYNSWYDKFSKKYDFVAQVDVDFVPDKNFLMKTLGYFNDPEVAFVGTPQIYGNIDESWIAKGAAEQAYGFYGVMQKGFFGRDMQLFIGANHIVRVRAHEDIGGYSAHIVEDHITGMKLYSKNWKSVYVPKVLAIGEGPSTWDSYFSQQMRWAYGLIDILFKKSPKLFKEMKTEHALNYFLLQQYYFYGLAQVTGILLIFLFFVFGIQSTNMEVLSLLSLYVPIVIWQQLFTLWLQKFNIEPKKESGMMWRSKLLNIAVWPVYFLALYGVLAGKKLTYKVTPKGTNQEDGVNVSFFVPHFVLGTLTAICIYLGIINNADAPLLMFWAIVNTSFMYFFFFGELAKKVLGQVETYLGNRNIIALKV